MTRACIPYAEMTARQLREELLMLQREKDQIQTKIEAAKLRKKECGQRPDADWLERAKFALITRKGRIRAAQELLGLAVKTEKASKHQQSATTFERCFLRTAKRVLPVDQYQQVLLAANHAMAIEGAGHGVGGEA